MVDRRWLLAMRSSHESDTKETPLGLVFIDPQSGGSRLIPGTRGATDWAWRPGPRP